MTLSPLMDETAAAKWLGVSIKTMQTWRFHGNGPDFVRLGGGKHGSVKYTLEALGEYVERRTLKNTGQRAA